MIEWYAWPGLSVKPTWKGQANVKLNAAVRMGARQCARA